MYLLTHRGRVVFIYEYGFTSAWALYEPNYITMTDVNVLDMLFNGDSSILDFKSNSHPNSEAFSTTDSDGLHPEQQHSSIFGGDLHPYQYHPENTKMLNLTSGVLDSEWPSSLLSPTLVILNPFD